MNFNYPINKPIYKLLDWIDKDKLIFTELSTNKNGFDYLMENIDKINYSYMSITNCRNPFLLVFMDKNIEQFDIDIMATNEFFYPLIEKYINYLTKWNNLCYNKSAIKLLEKHIDKIDWNVLSRNLNAIELLKTNMEKICWNELSCNENAIELLEKNIDKINWYNLCYNKNGYKILEKYLDKIDWSELSENKYAIKL